MIIAGVADTHTALWYLFNGGRLSVAAADFIDKAAAAGSQIVVSSISLAEIVYLIEKKRLPATAYVDLKVALEDPDHVFKEAPFTVEIVDAMKQVPRADVPDMPDRIVAATAIYFGVPALSRDGKIRASNVQTIWQAPPTNPRPASCQDDSNDSLHLCFCMLPDLAGRGLQYATRG